MPDLLLPDALPAVSPDLVYSSAKLELVACEVRFSPILKIAESLPANYQERIRKYFPELGQLRGIELASRESLPFEVTGQGTSWVFRTSDESSTTHLRSGSLSLQTAQYTHFPAFREKWDVVFKALIDTYEISTVKRLGLRYVNQFDPRPPAEWAELINPALASELRTFGSQVSRTSALVVLRVGQHFLNLRHGIEENNGYVLDLDMFTSADSEVGQVLALTDMFHETTTRMFRWCITDRMHELLEPNT